MARPAHIVSDATSLARHAIHHGAHPALHEMPENALDARSASLNGRIHTNVREK